MPTSVLMWNRLEPTPRSDKNVDAALGFEVRDALWMLTRQWQFGELDGEDAATAAFAKIGLHHAPVQFFGGPGSQPQPLDFRQAPLEKAVEQDVYVPDLPLRLEIGRHWLRLLRKHLSASEQTAIIAQFLTHPGLRFARPKSESLMDQFLNAAPLADECHMEALTALENGRLMDGWPLLKSLMTNPGASVSTLYLSKHNEAANKAGEALVAWFSRVYGHQPELAETWHPQHIEYQPQFAFADQQGRPLSVRSEQYHGDGIGWAGFSEGSAWAGLPATDVAKNAVAESVVIPAGVRYRGMASPRLWEMEDGQVDFGSIRATPTDLGRMLYAEFGLIYGNDWLIAPVELPLGGISQVTGVSVSDIFGGSTEMSAIAPTEEWAFLGLSGGGGQRLFLAAGAAVQQSSGPVEQVCLLRDEMANLVWAVENVLPNPLAGNRDAHKLARLTEDYLQGLEPPPEAESDNAAAFAYRLGTAMPENWIPLVAVPNKAQPAAGLSKRKVVLQRASLPRIVTDFPVQRVRPRTRLMGANLDDPQNPLPPFFIFEEEIPRAGTELSLRWKRARWFDGSVKVWLAVQKKTGRGEVDAGFQFDTLLKK